MSDDIIADSSTHTCDVKHLFAFMNYISENDFLGGWQIDLEHILWYAMLHEGCDFTPTDYPRIVGRQTAWHLRWLSKEAGGWHDCYNFLALDDWLAVYD